MASNTISAFTVLNSKPNSPSFSSSHSCRLPLQTNHLHCQNRGCSKNLLAFSMRTRRTRAVVAEGEAVSEESLASSVSVQVSPSDVLTMLFRAEGTMNETVIPAIYEGLEEIEGVTNLKVQVVEGIASVELTKQTTLQSTGVASGLVETLQGSGFKLQRLNLSFQDEDDTS